MFVFPGRLSGGEGTGRAMTLRPCPGPVGIRSALAYLAGGIAAVALGLAGGLVGNDARNAIVDFRLTGFRFGPLFSFCGGGRRGGFGENALIPRLRSEEHTSELQSLM